MRGSRWAVTFCKISQYPCMLPFLLYDAFPDRKAYKLNLNPGVLVIYMGLREYAYSHGEGEFYIVADMPGGKPIIHGYVPQLFTRSGSEVLEPVRQEDPLYGKVMTDFNRDLEEGSGNVKDHTYDYSKQGLENRMSL